MEKANLTSEEKENRDWLEYIVDYAYKNYRHRKVVIWGYYTDAFTLSDLLKEKYSIQSAFYVDSNSDLVDNHKCYPTSYLAGKSEEYYIIIPIGYYESIKQALLTWGYTEDDYIYFYDCVIKKRDNYYEDKHGNKIIGDYKNLKVFFAGFNSIINISKECCFEDVVISVNSNDNITIGEESCLKNTKLYAKNNNKFLIGKKCCFENTIFTLQYNNTINFEKNVELQGDSLYIDENNSWVVGSETILKYEGEWYVGSNNRIDFGSKVEIQGGSLCVGNYNEWLVGRKTIINYNEKFYIGNNNKITLENKVNFKDMGLSIGNHNEWIVGNETNFCYGNIYYGEYVAAKWGEQSYLVGNWSVQGYCNIKIGNRVTMLGGKYTTPTQLWINKYTSYEVGNDCMFSAGITVLTNDCHTIFDIKTKENINSSKEIAILKKIILGNHVWVGNRVTLLYGTQVGDGSVIGASSLVKKKFPNNCIVVGNPARLIRKNIAWCNQDCMDNIEACGLEYVNETIEV